VSGVRGLTHGVQVTVPWVRVAGEGPPRSADYKEEEEEE